MAKIDILTRLYARSMHVSEFNYEMLQPSVSLHSIIDPRSTDYLAQVATDPRYSGNIKKKYAEIKNVMEYYGFKRFAGGTNRVVYRHLDHQDILTKVAIDKNGLSNNPDELMCQRFLKPFCSKPYQVSRYGSVQMVERCLPITSREEFASVAGDIFDVIAQKFIGKYAINDFGTDYFMNWGFRLGFGPVLVDYPYVYPIDEQKLFCSLFDPRFGMICGGELDYDDGFNHIYCTKCGKKYSAKDLAIDEEKFRIITQGGHQEMKVVTGRGNKVLTEVTIEDPKKYVEPKNKRKPAVIRNSGEGFKVVTYYKEVKKGNKTKKNDSKGFNKNDQQRQIISKETEALTTKVIENPEVINTENKQLNLTENVEVKETVAIETTTSETVKETTIEESTLTPQTSEKKNAMFSRPRKFSVPAPFIPKAEEVVEETSDTMDKTEEEFGGDTFGSYSENDYDEESVTEELPEEENREDERSVEDCSGDSNDRSEDIVPEDKEDTTGDQDDVSEYSGESGIDEDSSCEEASEQEPVEESGEYFGLDTGESVVEEQENIEDTYVESDSYYPERSRKGNYARSNKNKQYMGKSNRRK